MEQPKEVIEVLSNDPSEETNPPVPDEANLMIDDIDQFVSIIAGWHGSRVMELEHLLNVPEGVVMVTDKAEITLAGDYRAGFIAGIEIALMRLGTLPFVAVGDTPDSSDGQVTH